MRLLQLSTLAHPPSAAAWLAVGVAAGMASAVAGGVATFPLWARSPRRFAVALLGLQAGALGVLAAVGIGAAVRSRQLLGHPVEELPTGALVQLRPVAGPGFASALGLSVVLFVALPAVVLAAAARCAGGEGRAERITACAVLAVQAAGWALLAALGTATRATGWAVWLAAVHLPLLAGAIATTWPRRRSPTANP